MSTVVMPSAVNPFSQNIPNFADGAASFYFDAVYPPSDDSISPTLKPVATVATTMDIPKVIPKVRKSGGGNKKGTSAERRATHNAVERARRESLNVRFLELAAALPATVGVRRPSKNLIVNKSINFVSDALAREDFYRAKIAELAAETDALRDEVNAVAQREGRHLVERRTDLTLPAPLTDERYERVRNSSVTSITSGLPAGFALGEDYDEDGSAGSDGGFGSSPPDGSMSFDQSLGNMGNNSPHHGGSVPVGVGEAHGFPTESAYTTFPTAHERSASTDGAPFTQAWPNAFSAAAGTAGVAAPAAGMLGNHAAAPKQGNGRGVHVPPSIDLAAANAAPTSAAGGGGGGGVGAQHGHGLPSDFLPPITPTTAMIFNNVLSSLETPSLEDAPPQSGTSG